MDQDSVSSATVSQQYLVENANSSVNREVKNEPVARETSVTKKEWMTVIILCFVNLINYMDRTTIAGLLTDIKDHYRYKTDELSGLLNTAFIISYMVFAPLFGYLGDRYNRKVIMSVGIFLWCLTTLVGSFMETYEWFLVFRMFVGIGEASYSTIAPTIISDLFIKDTRTKMLAFFYFAIPVGSGLGYMIATGVAGATGHWQSGLRVTPALGLLAIILVIFFVKDPIRGEREGGTHISHTSWLSDIKALFKNPSFMLSTAGFTCVSFVTGALAFWGPTFLELGTKLQSAAIPETDAKLWFGAITIVAGIIGVACGSIMAQKFRVRWNRSDPLICAFGLLVSAPLLFVAIMTCNQYMSICLFFIFVGQVALNLNWSIVADILLYVIIPTRRSTAEAVQILVAHALGDAGSPWLIGIISDNLKPLIRAPGQSKDMENFQSLQYALFLTIFVEVIGCSFFFLTAMYIERDKSAVDLTIADANEAEVTLIGNEEAER